MIAEVAFAFKKGLMRGPHPADGYSDALGAGSDGSLFMNGEGFYMFDREDPDSWNILKSKAKVSSIAPVNANLCYFIQATASGDVVSQYSAKGITNLPPMPGSTTPVAVSASGDGTMWTTGGDGVPYVYEPTSNSWSALVAPEGVLRLISVGSANFVLALVGDKGTTRIMTCVDGAWHPFVKDADGMTWVGACLDGSYWVRSGPKLTLTTNGTTVTFDLSDLQPVGFAAANRYGCYVYVQSEGRVLTAALGVIDAPAVPFPSFSGDQQTAYTAISTALGISARKGIRESYPNLDVSLEEYFTTVTTMACPSGVAPADWTAVKTQVLAEISDATVVRKLFTNITTLNDEINTLQLATYLEVVKMVGLPPQPSKQPKNSLDIVLGAIFDKIFNAAMSAVQAEAPEVTKVINLGLDVFKFAADQIAKKHGVPNSDVAFQLACSELAQMLEDTVVQMEQSKGAFEMAILSDWGKLSACGQAINSGLWYWPPDFDGTVLNNIGDSIKTNYYQTLMPVKWQIALIETLSSISARMTPYLKDVPAYALLYKLNGAPSEGVFWWWVCEALGAKASRDTDGPFPSQSLIKAIINTGAEPSDFFSGANGWALPVLKMRGYRPPPAGLPFSEWIDSASPMP